MQKQKNDLTKEEAKAFFVEVADHLMQAGGEAELSYSAEQRSLKARLYHNRDQGTLERFSAVCLKSSKEVLEKACGLTIDYSKTAQKVGQVRLRPHVGCFVQFDGDYSGLLILNFSAQAAMNLYRGNMLTMGLPEEELAQAHTSDEVVDVLGELINQLIGKIRSMIEQQHGLVARNSQPKAIAITEPISLTISPNFNQEQYRRLTLKADGAHFHIELALEQTEFQELDI